MQTKTAEGCNVDVNVLGLAEGCAIDVNVDEKQLRCNDDVNKNENYHLDGTVPSSRAEGVSLNTKLYTIIFNINDHKLPVNYHE